MPSEVVFVEDGPDEAEANGQNGEEQGEEASAALGAGGDVAFEGAEAEAGVLHAGRGSGEGEEEGLIEGGDDHQGNGGAELDFAQAGEFAGVVCSHDGGGDKGSGNQCEVEHGGQEAAVEGGQLEGRSRLRLGLRFIKQLFLWLRVELDAGPLGGVPGRLGNDAGGLGGFRLDGDGAGVDFKDTQLTASLRRE